MILMMLFGLMISFIIVLIMACNYIFSMMVYKDKEKMSSFECGFSMFGSSRVSFSMRYFLLTVIFVVFDIEVILLFPCFIYLGFYPSFEIMTLWSAFLLILVWGVIYEFREGALKWIK